MAGGAPRPTENQAASGCENAGLSLKNGRVYCRAFNYAECRELRASGWTQKALAEKYGVTVATIRRVTDPEFRKKFDAAARARTMSGVCPDCGKQGTTHHRKGGDLRCRECSNRAKRHAGFRFDARGNPTEVFCGHCRNWLAASLFGPRSRDPEHGGKRTCRHCEAALRQAYRERHKVPCSRCGTPTLSESERRRTDRPSKPSGLCMACWHAELSPEQRIANGRKGGLASGRARRAAA